MAALTDLFARIFGRNPQAQQGLAPAELEADWLIIGLGNPGAKYAATRHNVGYMAVDDVLAQDGDVLEPVRGMDLEVAPLCWGDTRVLAVRTTTFMNLSGDPIAPLAQALGIAADHIIVIHDELDLSANKIRLKQGGNENGHNGLKSLTHNLGTRDYLRVRIGIARPPKGSSIPDYVLAPVDAGPGFDTAIATAAEAARLIATQGLVQAQNRIHSR